MLKMGSVDLEALERDAFVILPLFSSAGRGRQRWNRSRTTSNARCSCTSDANDFDRSSTQRDAPPHARPLGSDEVVPSLWTRSSLGDMVHFVGLVEPEVSVHGRCRHSLVALAIVVAVAVPRAVSSAADSPVDHPIPTLGGDVGCADAAMPDGTVIGDSARTPFGLNRDVFGWHPSTGLIDIAPTEDSSLIDVDGNTLLYRTDDEWMLWTRDGGGTVLSLPDNFVPQFIAGDWVGGTRLMEGADSPGMWHRSTGFAPANRSIAAHWIVDINSSGQAVLQALMGSGRQRGSLWDPDGRVTPLGNPYGTGVDIFPHDINADGVIVGHADLLPGSDTRAWVWSDGEMAPVGPPTAQAKALLVNDNGSIAGTIWGLVGGAYFDVPFLWTPRDGLVTLPVPARPYALSRHDQIVGNQTQLGLAFTWNPVQGYLALGTSSPFTAYGMNDSGRVAGCNVLLPHAWDVTTTVRTDWTAAERMRLAEMRTFYGYSTDTELVKFGVYVLAFINAIDPQPAPTPVVLDSPGNASSTTVTWQPGEMSVLNSVEDRWHLNDEDAHRWGFLVLSFIAAIQGA
jgi:uncharacterized membrane protein